MKKAIVLILTLLVLLFCATAQAEPTAEPTLSPAPASAPSGLITFKSTGEKVVRVQLRLRELGYFNYKPTGSFQDMSVKSTIKFQQMQVDANGQPIMADGSIGAQTMDLLFSRAAQRGDIVASIPFGPQLSGSPTVTGVQTPWTEVKTALTPNQTYTFTDFNTGATFNMTFIGGEQHAEMECTSAADTATFLTCFGGAFNYSKRPMVLMLGTRAIAASMQGEPHGEDTLPGNDMNGHVCVYFYGSASHVGSLPDVEHMNQINKAAGS